MSVFIQWNIRGLQANCEELSLLLSQLLTPNLILNVAIVKTTVNPTTALTTGMPLTAVS